MLLHLSLLGYEDSLPGIMMIEDAFAFVRSSEQIIKRISYGIEHQISR